MSERRRKVAVARRRGAAYFSGSPRSKFSADSEWLWSFPAPLGFLEAQTQWLVSSPWLQQNPAKCLCSFLAPHTYPSKTIFCGSCDEAPSWQAVNLGLRGVEKKSVLISLPSGVLIPIATPPRKSQGTLWFVNASDPIKSCAFNLQTRGENQTYKSVLCVAFIAYTTRGTLLQLYRAKIISKRRERMNKSVQQLNVQRAF